MATRFITEFYVEKRVRYAFETWALPDYIQHNALAATGRDSAIDILRVEHCKIAEHWGVVQPVPEKSANSNGMF